MSYFLPSQGLQTRMARESTYGTVPGSPAWKILQGIGIRPNDRITKNPVSVPGSLIPTTFQTVDRFSEGSVEGSVDYNALWAVFAGRFGIPNTTSAGSPLAYTHTWSWDGKRPIRPVSYTVDAGWPSGDLERFPGWIFNAFSVSGDRENGFDVSGSGFGKASVDSPPANPGGVTLERQTLSKTGTVSGGTFTITFQGETTATIAYNANNAAVLAALEALIQFQPGDLTLGGGPVNTTPVTIDFGGPFAGIDVSLMTVDSTLLTGGGSYGIVQTTAGGDTATVVPVVPASALDGNIYLDTSWAGLGGTQLGYIASVTFDMPEGLDRVKPINSSLATDGVIDMADQDLGIDLTFFRNSTELAQKTRVKNSTLIYPRLLWTSTNEINTGTPYLLRIDASMIYEGVDDSGDTSGAASRNYPGRLVADPVTGKALEITLRNAIASI